MSILVFVKGMPYARSAVQHGGMVARLTGAAVTLLSTTDLKTSAETAEETLRRAAELLPDLQVLPLVRQAGAVKSILTEVREDGYDLIVLQARRAIRYRKRLGKKIGRLVAIESPISVLVVKDQDKPAALDRILICTGGKAPANIVIEKGAALTAAAGAEVTLLHIITPVPSMYTGMNEMEESFEELLQTDTPTARHLRGAAKILADHNVAARLKVRQGDVTDEIMLEGDAGSYDLIIIGAAPGGNRLKEWFMGDVTRSLVNHAPCPVLVAR